MSKLPGKCLVDTNVPVTVRQNPLPVPSDFDGEYTLSR